ncbi:MAG: hypothetical protein Q9166_002554 [cf. Caloplaca sp. 2 TL-2023]
MDPCWRQCFTHELACKDNDWPCFCHKARRTSLLNDTVICIRRSCTGDRSFNPTALLTPFTETCRIPIPPDNLANANLLATQGTTSTSNSTSSGTPNDIAANAPGSRVATATARAAKANVITTTYIGIATNVNGQQEIFTVPALVGLTGTIYGSPVTQVQGTATPTSVITLPWPTLSVGYFFTNSASGAVTILSGKAAGTSLGPNVGVTTRTSVVAAATSRASSQQTGDSGEGGTAFEANEGTKIGAESSLGLMVVLLVGVMWF